MAESDVAGSSFERYDQHLLSGGELLRQSRIDEAKREFTAALALRPADGKALALLGLACFRSGAFREALPVYEQLVQLHPGDASYRLNLGLVHLKLGNARFAIDELARSRDLDPSQGRAVSYLGLAYARAGQYAEAYQAFLQARQTDLAREMEQYLSVEVREAIAETIHVPTAAQDEGSAKAAAKAAAAKLVETRAAESRASAEARVVEARARAEAEAAATAQARAAAEIKAAAKAAIKPPSVAAAGEPAAADPELSASPDELAELFAFSDAPADASATSAVAAGVPAGKSRVTESPSPESPASESPAPGAPASGASAGNGRGDPWAVEGDGEGARAGLGHRTVTARGPAVVPPDDLDDEEIEIEFSAIPEAGPPAAIAAASGPVIQPRNGVVRALSSGVISRAVADALPSAAAVGAASRVAPGNRPPMPLSEFATSRLIRPDDGEHVFEISAGGVLIVRVAEKIFARTEGVDVTGGRLAYEAASRRVRGATTSEAFSSDGRQMFVVTGHGHMIAAPLGGQFTAVTLDDDILYLREDLVFAYEADLRWENGSVPGSGGKLHMVQFRGSGSVAFRSARPLLAIKLAQEKVLYIDATALAGWIGRVVPRVVSPVGSGQSELFVECTGEGVVLIEEEQHVLGIGAAVAGATLEAVSAVHGPAAARAGVS